jgi:hypothetical protein
MTPEEHKEKHIQLHRAFDELLADFINHNPHIESITKMPIITLMEWSARQIENPTH